MSEEQQKVQVEFRVLPPEEVPVRKFRSLDPDSKAGQLREKIGALAVKQAFETVAKPNEIYRLAKVIGIKLSIRKWDKATNRIIAVRTK